MKKFLFPLLYFQVGILVFGILYFGADAILSRISGASMIQKQQSGKYDVYVLSNDVHTDIVFPQETDIIDWTEVFPTRNNLSKDSLYKYVAVIA